MYVAAYRLLLCDQASGMNNILFYLSKVELMYGILFSFFNTIYIQRIYVQIDCMKNSSHGND